MTKSKNRSNRQKPQQIGSRQLSQATLARVIGGEGIVPPTEPSTGIIIVKGG